MLPAEVQQAVDLFAQFGSKAEAARVAGIAVNTLKDRLTRAERLGKSGHSPVATHLQPSCNPSATHLQFANSAHTQIRNKHSHFEKQEIPQIRGNPPQIASKRHLIIPDCQVKPGVDIDHLEWIGKYIADKKPDVVIQIGDFADLPSLSSYDVGKKSFEGRRYKADLEASHTGMQRLCANWGYSPRMVLTFGNHENRISRVVDSDPKLDGTIGLDDLQFESFGWEVYPFLEPVRVDGIEYCHYFTSGVMGRPASSAQVVLRERQGSAVQGHVQHHDIAIHKKTQKFALFSGTCYTHAEEYLGPQGNGQKPGIWVLNEVDGDGGADLMFVSLNFLRKKYA